MAVFLMPATVTSSYVMLDGQTVGVVERVHTDATYVGLDGAEHTGYRWLPADENLPADLSPGPVTAGHAALLLLALHGHDVETAAANLLAPPSPRKAA